MDLNALDLNLIRVFDALWQERGVTRAGDRVGLSQPAVSAALNRLRHALGDQLFVRRGNEMVPTPRAEELAPRARAALAEIGRMLAPGPAFDPAGLERTFTFLGSDFFSMLLMPRLAERLGEEAPGVRLRLLDSAHGDVPRLLRDDGVDMALEQPIEVPEGVSREVMFRAPFVIVTARGNPGVAGLAEGARMPMKVFCGLEHAIRSVDGSMRGRVDAALEEQGRHRRVTLALPHFQAVALAVAQGRHLAALPVQFARAVRDSVPLRIFAPPFEIPVPEISLYWHARHDRDPAHRWMRARTLGLVAELGFRDL
ncbi:LysR family transcriptional regulator [Defluviimonas salinarum]|uniref:LysR family transcriptional regulator n=1 Tax=Defluviimonas salinarum TaxID=2992147 RepID=A0ABT3J2G8_9RHOB|nr:LysR family transcriptional regulator [Defluviimonas salinarum]MCW3781660.1 LysR family transcriptional regulator [Defluviimonas salinarum]